MILKDEIDCRQEVCNHVTGTILTAFQRKDIYVTWLLKRHIPLPESLAEKTLEFCKSNEGLNEEETVLLWQSLNERNLLPDVWNNKSVNYVLEHLAIEQEPQERNRQIDWKDEKNSNICR